MTKYAVFDTLLDGVLVINQDRKLIYANESAMALLSLPMKILKKELAIYSLVQFDDPDIFCMPNGTWGMYEATPYKELKFKSTSGEEGRVRVAIQPQPEASGNHWIVYLRDVTLEEGLYRKYRSQIEKKEGIIAELKETQNQLVQSSKIAMLGQIIPAISHELNNPLTVVVSSAEELVEIVNSDSVDMDVVRQLSTYLYKGAQRIMGLSKQLKSFLHGPLSPDRLSYSDMHLTIESAVNFVQTFTVSKQVEVKNNIPKDLPHTLIDPTLIEQVALNFIRNSVDAILEANTGKPGVVEINGIYEAKKNVIRIEFVDNGPGIPPGILKKLFTPFFTTKEVGKGTGLGLSICSAIAERHGGSITVQSEIGKGTSFLLTIPVRAATEKAEVHDTNLIFENLKILLVDDEPWIRSIQKRILSQLGCTVSEASDGKEGLMICEQHPPDVIITDLLMPGMSGVEFAKSVRKICPLTRIILLTGSAALDSIDTECAVFDDLITKPFPNETIRRAILKVMSKATAP